MTAFFADHFRAALFTTPTLLDSATIRVYLLRKSPDFSESASSYLGARTITELLATGPGWTVVPGTPGTITTSARTQGSSKYIIFTEYPFTWLSGTVEAEGLAVEYVGTVNTVTNPLIFVSDSPMIGKRQLIGSGDTLTAVPDVPNLGGTSNRWLMGWGALPPTITLTTSSATDDIIDTTTTHNYTAGTAVQFLTLTGGAGLSVGPTYYVVATSLGATTFRVATTSGGAAIGFTTNITAGTVRVVGASLTPVEGPLAISKDAPDFEISGIQHVWLYPQRVNMVANPSFELVGTNFWSSNGTITRIAGGSPRGGAWAGQFSGATPIVAESNLFPVLGYEQWTIQLMAKGTGSLRVGLVYWDGEYRETIADWGEESEIWTLAPDGFVHIAVHRRAFEGDQAMVRVECSSSSMVIDRVLAEQGFLKDWPYFDGDERYGAKDDFTWYGGSTRQGGSYSLWYNNKRAVTGRLFTRTVDPADPSGIVTDDVIEEQGLVYEWVPAGTIVEPHFDVLYPHDVRAAVPAKPPGVIAYRANREELLKIDNPWQPWGSELP